MQGLGCGYLWGGRHFSGSRECDPYGLSVTIIVFSMYYISLLFNGQIKSLFANLMVASSFYTLLIIALGS